MRVARGWMPRTAPAGTRSRTFWSNSGLGVTYEPFMPWFEALGSDMRDAAATIRNDVLPMLETYGSLDGYRRFCAEQAADSGQPKSLYLLAATDIILERYDEA